MKVVVLSRLFAEKIIPEVKQPHAVISITDPTNREPAKFEERDSLKGVLYLKFYDIDFSDGNETPGRAAVLREYGHGLITDEQADEVIDFVKEMRFKVRAFICHCDAGVSRSSGVGAAVLRILTGSDEKIFKDPRYIPNMYVYRKVLNRYYARVEEFIKEDVCHEE